MQLALRLTEADDAERRTEEACPVERLVILRCSRPGCMRTENIHFDSTMPEGTTEIKMACPTHQRDGDFLEESYYNEHGQWFGPNGWQ